MGAAELAIVLPGTEKKVMTKVPDTGVMYDLIIIGGGPAGMTAGLYAARKQIETLLVSMDLGGQVLLTKDVENYMGYYYITGQELMDKFQAQVSQFPIAVGLGEEVTALRREEGRFGITVKSGKTFTGRSVIIGTGKRSRPLNVPGEKEFAGSGVTYCSTCDAPLFAGRAVAVIGGGNSALTACADLMPIATRIYVINVAPSWQADAVLAKKAEASEKVELLLGHEVVEIRGRDRVASILVRARQTGETRELPVEGVFVEIGLIPNSEFAKGVVEMNAAGEIVTDCSNHTNVPGLFAAGDVTNVPEKQIIVAAGEGCKAALAAFAHLLQVE